MMKYEWEKDIDILAIHTALLPLNHNGKLPPNARIIGVVVAEMENVEAAYIETHQVNAMEGADLMLDAMVDLDTYRLNCLGEAGFPFAESAKD